MARSCRLGMSAPCPLMPSEADSTCSNRVLRVLTHRHRPCLTTRTPALRRQLRCRTVRNDFAGTTDKSGSRCKKTRRRIARAPRFSICLVIARASRRSRCREGLECAPRARPSVHRRRSHRLEGWSGRSALSESEASNHMPFLADFAVTAPELKFSVHTGSRWMRA